MTPNISKSRVVTPAKAGVQGSPEDGAGIWIAAFAGMTN